MNNKKGTMTSNYYWRITFLFFFNYYIE